MANRYESFEQARVPVERLYELGAELSRVGVDSDRAPEIEDEIRSLFAEPDEKRVAIRLRAATVFCHQLAES